MIIDSSLTVTRFVTYLLFMYYNSFPNIYSTIVTVMDPPGGGGSQMGLRRVSDRSQTGLRRSQTGLRRISDGSQICCSKSILAVGNISRDIITYQICKSKFLIFVFPFFQSQTTKLVIRVRKNTVKSPAR